MIKIKSKLESNLFDGVLVKKGLNYIDEAIYKKLSKNKVFNKFCELGYIAGVAISKVKEVKQEIKNRPDFASMSYQELKKYVKEHNIKVKSQSKADILEALGV